MTAKESVDNRTSNTRDEFLISKYFDYQQSLISRRWQYLAVYVVIIGILYNTLIRVEQNKLLKIVIELTSIIISRLLLQFVSLAAERLEKTQAILSKEHNFQVIDAPIDGKFRFKSTTVLIYLSIISITCGWLSLLLQDDIITFTIITSLFVSSLFLLRWRPCSEDAG